MDNPPLNLYSVSVPMFSGALKNLSTFAAKGEANARERGVDPQVFLTARLAPDMLPFARQIQIATDNAKGAACRLAGRDVPSWADEEKTFEELQGRISKARDLLAGFKAEEFADQAAASGAGYVIMALGQTSGYYCSPNAAYETLGPINPGEFTSVRDLISDVADALAKRGIKTIVYIAADGPRNATTIRRATSPTQVKMQEKTYAVSTPPAASWWIICSPSGRAAPRWRRATPRASFSGWALCRALTPGCASWSER